MKPPTPIVFVLLHAPQRLTHSLVQSTLKLTGKYTLPQREVTCGRRPKAKTRGKVRKRVSHSLVRRDVEEEPLVLRGCVLWSVRARVAEDGQEGTVRLGLLGAAKERKGGVGDLRE